MREIFSFSTVFRPALRPTQLFIKWAPGLFPQGVKKPVRKTDHSHASSIELKNSIRINGVMLIKHRDNFTIHINNNLLFESL